MAITGYYPEMNEKKPLAHLEVQYAYGGGHWVYSPFELKTSRSVKFERQYTAKDLIKGSHKVGWYVYKVTDKGLKELAAQYEISRECLLD